MTGNSSNCRLLTVGDAARRLGCRAWQVRRLFERGLLPPPPRVGAYRVIPVADLKWVEAALKQVGYLPGTLLVDAAPTDREPDES
jgi:hypothetical protein